MSLQGSLETVGEGQEKQRGKPGTGTGRHVRPSLALEALLGGGWKPGCFSWMVPPSFSLIQRLFTGHLLGLKLGSKYEGYSSEKEKVHSILIEK